MQWKRVNGQVIVFYPNVDGFVLIHVHGRVMTLDVCRSSRISSESAPPLHSTEGRRHLLEKATERMKSGMAGWQAKLLQRQGSQGKAYGEQTVRRPWDEGGPI